MQINSNILNIVIVNIVYIDKYVNCYKIETVGII